MRMTNLMLKLQMKKLRCYNKKTLSQNKWRRNFNRCFLRHFHFFFNAIYFTNALNSAFKYCWMSFSGMLTSGIPAAKGAISYVP